jgi:hypothetical protein
LAVSYQQREFDMFKITRLTRMNVDALTVLLTQDESTRVTVASTTATFDMAPGEAQRLIATLLQRAAQSQERGGRHYRSLFAVRRKVAAVAASAANADGDA